MSVQADTILGTTVDKYEIVRQLGGGSQGETFLAHDPDGAHVVLKRFSIRQMRSWKSLELFRREIATLRILDHPAIPTFLADIELDESHYLAQEYIDGEVLSELIAAGPLPEPQLRAVARDVLEVLQYLHELNPPVVHRDVKPSNIIRRPDGRHVLVDFGGVQMIVAQDTGGSTVVGTTGYMPSEQLVGRAEPPSDLYALGATLAHLATGIHPSQLPTRRLRLDWRDAAPDVPPRLAQLIDAMLDPAPEDRPASARAALATLLDDASALTVTAPKDQRIETLNPMVATMERQMRRTPHVIQLSLADGHKRGMFFGGSVGVLLSLVIVGLDVIVLQVILCLALLAVGKTAFGMFSEAEELFVYASGNAEVRTTDSKGIIRVIRGTLALSDDGLVIERLNGQITPIARSLTPEKAAWFAREAEQFIEGSHHRMLAEASPPPPENLDTPADDDAAEPVVEPEPEPPRPAAPAIEALPDRESHFDREVEAEATQIRTDRPEFERLALIVPPEGILPRGALDRQSRHASHTVFDLSTKVGTATAWRSVKLAVAGVLLALIVKSSAVGIIAVTAAVVWFLAAVFGVREERLTVFRDREFTLQVGDGRLPDVQGRLLPEVRVDGRELFLLTEEGLKIEVGHAVPPADRLWVGYLILEALNRDQL